MTIDPQELGRARHLYERGLYLQAYRLTERHGSLREWSGTDARLFAGRLAIQLGAPRLGQAIHLRAWRADRDAPEARIYACYALAHLRGPWEGLSFFRQHGIAQDGPPEQRAHGLSLEAQILVSVRDFVAADARLAEARALAADASWPHVVRAYLLEEQDRPEASLESARRALEIHPGSSQAMMAEAQALIALGRDDDALERLDVASRETESGRIAQFLVSLLVANRDHRGALTVLDRVVELSPLMEPGLARALAAQRAEAHYNCGEMEAALEHARKTELPYFRKMVERLEQGVDGKRVALDVGFVRQHHMTCAPATLTAISKFWSREAEHLDVAEQICYDGTPAHSERNWATANGWHVREFTVTWGSAVALLDRGVPFTLTTIGPTDGHLQAVIGYDARRGTLIVRDPSYRNEVEYVGDDLLEGARATGPRGMAMVPQDRSELLDGLDLPDAELWDRSHDVQTALAEHDRTRAHDVYRAMSSIDSEHILTQYVRRALAAYDADPVGLLAFADLMLQRFPHSARLLLSKLSYLSELGRDNECLELLDDVCRSRNVHPSLQLTYAAELARDPRRHDDARRILRRVLRSGYVDARCLSTLADLEWDAEHYDDALRIYRFASCLSDKDESLAMGYFTAACWVDRAAEAERFLEQRAEQLGSQSPAALVTLCQARWQTGQPARSVEALEEALRLHPDDAALQLTASRVHGLGGRLELAQAALESAEPRAKRADWLQASAEIAERSGDLRRAIELLQQAIEIAPLSIGAHQNVTRLLASVEGPRVALAQLDAVCERFPHNLTLQKLRVEWLIEHDRPAAEPALRAMIEASSVNIWARLQLALLLGERGEFREAFAEAELAALLEPNEASCHSVRGRLFTLAGRRADAAEAFREAIRLSVAMEPPIRGLLAVCCSDDERRDALDLVRQEILRQLSAGEAPAIYRGFASAFMEQEQLLTSLEELRRTRPDHRRCWSTTIRQLASMDRVDEARRLADEYAERFPRTIEAWFEVAWICSVTGDAEGETRALRQILRIDPAFGQAHRRLAEIAKLDERPEDARRLLQEAIALSPMDASNHGELAELVWNLGERDAALSSIERCLGLDSEQSWAWDALRAWAAESGCPERAVTFARELARRRGGEVRVWIKLAEMLAENGAVDDGLEAMRSALEVDPRSIEAHDRYATMLAEAGRYDEALAACSPEAWSEEPPLPLRGRAAWVESRRGGLQQAIEQMEAILETAPAYVWGLQQLTEWYRNAQDAHAYYDAAVRLARLTPDEPVSLGILGHARLVNDDDDGAKADFRRAFELAPGYAFAGRNLFDLQIESRELEAAERTLLQLTALLQPATTLALKIRLAVAAGDWESAYQGFCVLCRSPGVDEDELREVTGCVSGSRPEHVAALLVELLGEKDVHPLVGELWITASAPDDLWKSCRLKIEALEPGSEVRRGAQRRLLERLGKTQQTGRIKRFIAAYTEELEGDPILWGTTLYALAAVGQWERLLQWAGDWRRREGLAGWMLSNIVTAMRCTGRVDDAYQASMHAMMLDPDGSLDRHHGWLAVEEALRDESAVAETWLSRMSEAGMGKWESFLALLARAVLKAGCVEEGAARFELARGLLLQAHGHVPSYRDQPALREVYRRCVRAIGRKRGGVGGFVWRVRTLRA